MVVPSHRWIAVAQVEDIPSSRKLVREAEGVSLLLVRAGSEVLAVRNRCTHLGQPLDGGRLMAGGIQCPFHGACFDLRTGAALNGPAVAPVACFAVKVEAGEIFVSFGDDR